MAKIRNERLLRALLDGATIQARHKKVQTVFFDLDTQDALRMLIAETDAWAFQVKGGVYPHDPLRSAAEQFLASCKDGNVPELLDYYADIFKEALK
jgi:hypothetical protein